jgi:hypothetical protein
MLLCGNRCVCVSAIAVPVGTIAYMNEVAHCPGSVFSDVQFCYDLELPASFVPTANDGEVEAFECLVCTVPHAR